MYLYLFVHICVYKYIYPYVYVCRHMDICIYVCVCNYIFICIYMCVCVCVCVIMYQLRQVFDFKAETSWTRSPREEEELFNAMWTSKQELNRHFRKFWSTLQGSLIELLAMSYWRGKGYDRSSRHLTFLLNRSLLSSKIKSGFLFLSDLKLKHTGENIQDHMLQELIYCWKQKYTGNSNVEQPDSPPPPPAKRK